MPRRGAGRKNIRQLISIRGATLNQKPLARKVQLVNKFAPFWDKPSVLESKKYNDWS
jgi:hypothetical protein